MTKQMIEVMQRRGELLARVAAQREQVADTASRWKAPLALADQGLAVVHFARSHPVVMSGVAALLAARRRSVVGIAIGAWRLWKSYRAVFISAKKTSS